MKRHVIDSGTELSDKLIEDIYEQLEIGDELLIERIGKKLDPQRESLMLLKAGFIHVVQTARSNVKNGYTIHCVKDFLSHTICGWSNFHQLIGIYII